MSKKRPQLEYVRTFENSYYELWRESQTDLDYVVLKVPGLKKVSEKYHQDYSINIDVEARNPLAQANRDISAKLMKASESLKNGEIKGLVYVIENGQEAHTRPFILGKNMAGKKIIINFEDPIGNHLAEMGYVVKNVGNYKDKQKDVKSCRVIAIDTVKNCLRDEDFVRKIFDQSAEINLTKMVLAQGSDNFSQFLNEEKKLKYVHGDLLDESHAINYKAWYKGHDYVRKINDGKYSENLSASTIDLLHKIDERRIKKDTPNNSVEDASISKKENTQQSERR